MKIHCIWEHNGNDTLLYSNQYAGAFVRGATKELAIEKMQKEIEAYFHWRGDFVPEFSGIEIIQEKLSKLQICDADSDVIFESEMRPMTREEYESLKKLTLKSACDFYKLYEQIPDKEKSAMPDRKTFYGAVPRTAREMYEHTKGVNAYYFNEIGVCADNEGTICECRKRGFELLEKQPDYLSSRVFCGSYDEKWSL